MVSQIFVFLLMVDAAAVLVGQLTRWDYTFGLIVAYWAILTVKNFVDWRRGK